MELFAKGVRRGPVLRGVAVLAVAANFFLLELWLIHAEPKHPGHVVEVVTERIRVGWRTDDQVERFYIGFLENIRLQNLASEPLLGEFGKFDGTSRHLFQGPRKASEDLPCRKLLFAPHVPGI